MKAKLAGLGILLLVILLAAVYTMFGRSRTAVEISGYVGGEKIGLLEDEEVRNLIQRKYHLKIDYSRAGSIEMVTADHTGMDFLFPSSQTALELYETQFGYPVKSEIVLNTPIVLYARAPVAEALLREGTAWEENGVCYVDMEKLAGCIENGTAWSEIGLPELYGNVTVSTTDPTKSNSGNMFAGLLANTLCGGTADETTVEAVLPRLQTIFRNLGYMESSSSDLFEQFLKTGIGAKPMIAGYENQILEFAVENPETWEQVKEDIRIMYPSPTVWSSHVFIALDEQGAAGIDALMDEEVQKMAWDRHGFRTGINGSASGTEQFGVDGVADEVTRVMNMPDADTMERIIEALQ